MKIEHLTHWTGGLSSMSANALINHGYTSKGDVLRDFSAGKIAIKKDGGGSTVYGLGRKGIAEVKSWLKIDEKPSQSEIDAAIILLVKNGYLVGK